MKNTLYNYILPDAAGNIEKVLKSLDEWFEFDGVDVKDIEQALKPIFGKRNNNAFMDMWIDYDKQILGKYELGRISLLPETDKQMVYKGFIDYIQMRIEELADDVFGKKIDIVITETLSKTVSIRTKDDEDAYIIAKDMYYNEEIVLDADDYLESNIELAENQGDTKFFYKADLNTSERDKALLLILPIGGTKPEWIKTDKVIDVSIDDNNNYLIKTVANTYTNNIDEFIRRNNKFDISVVKSAKSEENLYLVRNNLTNGQCLKNTKEEAQQYVLERLTHTYFTNLESIDRNVEPLFEKKDMYGEDDIDNMIKVAREHKDIVEEYIENNSSQWDRDRSVLLKAINEPDFFSESFNAYDSDICEQFIAIMEKYNDDVTKEKKNEQTAVKGK